MDGYYRPREFLAVDAESAADFVRATAQTFHPEDREAFFDRVLTSLLLGEDENDNDDKR